MPDILPIERGDFKALDDDQSESDLRKYKLDARGKAKGLAVAYYEPGKDKPGLMQLKREMVDTRGVGKEHEKGSVSRRLEISRMTEMAQPIERMRVQESTIPMQNLYNEQVNGVKEEHRLKNEHLRSLFLPVEAPQSIEMFNKKNFLHIDKRSGKLLNEDLPKSAGSKKYGLAQIRVYK